MKLRITYSLEVASIAASAFFAETQKNLSQRNIFTRFFQNTEDGSVYNFIGNLDISDTATKYCFTATDSSTKEISFFVR